ncbi:sensor histidine kinase [Actinomycetota bacterium]
MADQTTRLVERVGWGRLDLLLPLFTLLVTLAGLASAAARSPASVEWYHWLLAPALGLLLLARRRSPIGVLVASIVLLIGMYAAGGPALGLELPVAAAFFSAAERGRLRVAAAVAVLLLLVAYGYRMSTQGGFLKFIGIETTTSAVVLGGAIGAGDAVRSRRRQRSSQEERARLLARHREDELARSIETERQALARDVHDVLGHAMVVISTQASVAAEALDEAPDEARAALGHIKDTSRQALTEVRSSLALLRGGEGGERTPVPSLDLLDGLVERVRESGLQVDVDRQLDGLVLPTTVSSAAYRIVQEALTNVLRHSTAEEAQVRLSRKASDLVIEVSDNGPAPNGWRPGSGIRGMTDRAAALGGRLRAGSGAPAGFMVHAEIPVPGAGT